MEIVEIVIVIVALLEGIQVLAQFFGTGFRFRRKLEKTLRESLDAAKNEIKTEISNEIKPKISRQVETSLRDALRQAADRAAGEEPASTSQRDQPSHSNPNSQS